MGYAARRNPTAAYFRTAEGAADNREARAKAEADRRRAEDDRRQREFDALVAAVHAPNAKERFSPVRLGMARTYLASQGIAVPEPARG